MVFAAALASRDTAPSPAWVTLPISLLVLGTACSVYPASRIAKAWGRKKLFMVAMAVGVVAALSAMISLNAGSFTGFTVSAVLLGSVIAVGQQFRFAAMESVEPAEMPMAASRLLTAGLVSAWLGPELVPFGQQLISDTFSGAFLLLAGLFVIAFCIIGFGFKNVDIKSEDQLTTRTSSSQLLKNSGFWVAAASGAVGYGVMSFIMTATPISMHEMDGFSLMDTKWVIQSHIMAMFLPSLFAGFLIQRLGYVRMIFSGLVVLLGCVLLGMIDKSFMHYWWALVLLGIAWNFLFVAGTALLPTTHEPEDKHKAQGLNDSLVFGSQAFGALTSGMFLQWLGWDGLLMMTIAPIAVLAIFVFWWHSKARVDYRPTEETIPE